MSYEEAITTTKRQLAREQEDLPVLEDLIINESNKSFGTLERALLVEKVEEALYKKEERIANREAKLYRLQLSEAASKSEDSIEDYPF